LSFNGQVIELLNQLLTLLRAQVREERAPEPEWEPDEPAPRKSKYKPGSQEWFKQLPPPRPDPNAISMNSIARCFIRKPPRIPGSQNKRSNGLWCYW
jgi:hypothetical protein